MLIVTLMFIHIRSGYGKCKRKLKAPSGSGAEAVEKPTWPWFAQMSFLDCNSSQLIGTENMPPPHSETFNDDGLDSQVSTIISVDDDVDLNDPDILREVSLCSVGFKICDFFGVKCQMRPNLFSQILNNSGVPPSSEDTMGHVSGIAASSSPTTAGTNAPVEPSKKRTGSLSSARGGKESKLDAETKTALKNAAIAVQKSAQNVRF